MARYNVDLQDNEGNAYQIMANPDSVAEFSPAANRENIRSGETYRVIFGKIMKYLSEVGNAAYVGLANNCTTTIAGFALDARQGKELMDRINELNRDLKFPDGTGFYPDIKDGVHGYNTDSKRGADTFIPFRADEVAMFEITIPNTTEDNILVTVTDKLGFKDAPNVIFVSAANHLTIDAIYNPYKTITTDAKTMVKLCAYAPTQKIEYRAVAEVFPTITKDSIAIKAKAFVSGVGDKVAHVVIARFV